MSLHTTLCVVLTRWIAVARPLQAKSLLTKGRALRAYGIVLLWCLAIEVSIILMGYLTPDDDEKITFIRHLYKFVTMSAPVIALVPFNISIIYILCRPKKSLRKPCVSETQGRVSIRCSEANNDQVPNRVVTKVQKQNRGRLAINRLVISVLCVSVTSCCIYPLTMFTYRVTPKV